MIKKSTTQAIDPQVKTYFLLSTLVHTTLLIHHILSIIRIDGDHIFTDRLES